jgi:hypothetical protein
MLEDVAHIRGLLLLLTKDPPAFQSTSDGVHIELLRLGITRDGPKEAIVFRDGLLITEEFIIGRHRN